MPAQHPETGPTNEELIRRYSVPFDFRTANSDELVAIAEGSYSLHDIERIYAEMIRRNEREKGYHQGVIKALRAVRTIRDARYTDDGSVRSEPHDIAEIRYAFHGIIQKSFQNQ